jgi:hypothetical protein
MECVPFHVSRPVDAARHPSRASDGVCRFAAALFRTPERFVTDLKAIGMPNSDRTLQAVISQAFAIETSGLPGELRIAICLKEARNLPALQADMTRRPVQPSHSHQCDARPAHARITTSASAL